MPTRERATSIRRLERASGRLGSAALARMQERLPWFAEMPPQQRSWIGLVMQAGIAAFVQWLRGLDREPRLPVDVFASAPRELTRAVTLQQTVELVRVAVDVVEEGLGELAGSGDESALREAALRFSREIAFAAAEVYATAAEERGAWDARLEALVVDSLLRGDDDGTLASRAAALGWGTPSAITAVAGRSPGEEPSVVLDRLQRCARGEGLPVLGSVHGLQLVAVLGLADPAEALAAGAAVLPAFGDGAVVVGPAVDNLAAAGRSAAAALSGLAAAPAWPGAPRPVHADELLAERALAGDLDARQELVSGVYDALSGSDHTLLDTLACYLDCGRSLEATARVLFLHPNTVRYRLRKVSARCHLSATQPRDAFALQVALALGRVGAGV